MRYVVGLEKVMAEELVVHLDDDVGVVCSYGPLIYVVWRRHDSTMPIEMADRAIDGLIHRYGDGRKFFYVHRAPPKTLGVKSEPEVRPRAMKHFEDHDARFVAAAVAIESDGFGASVVRSVSAGVMLVRRTAVKTEVFKDARDGVRWLAEESRRHPGAVPFDGEGAVAALQRGGFTLVFSGA